MRINWRKACVSWRNTFIAVAVGMSVGLWLKELPGVWFWELWGMLPVWLVAIIPEMIYGVVRGIRRYRAAAHRSPMR